MHIIYSVPKNRDPFGQARGVAVLKVGLYVTCSSRVRHACVTRWGVAHFPTAVHGELRLWVRGGVDEVAITDTIVTFFFSNFYCHGTTNGPLRDLEYFMVRLEMMTAG